MQQKHLRAFAAIVLGCVSVAALATEGQTIYYNGKVFTSNAQQLWAQGVAVEGRLIRAVGTTQQVLALAGKDSKLVDLQGLTMIPGFNDAHVHPFDSTSFPRAAQLNSPADFVPAPGPSLEEVIALIKRGAAENPPGTWLMVSVGTRIVEDPSANRFSLRDAAPDHPVLLATWFGHGTYLNDRAMEVLGIGEQAPDPFGGHYDRVPETNIINGVAHEYAEHLIRRFFAEQMTDEELISLYTKFAVNAAQMGYTSVQEFSIGVSPERHLELVEKSQVPIRWRAICFPLTLDERCDVPSRFSPTKPAAHLTASGIKWVADGTFIERLAFLRKDYADAPGLRGRLNFTASAIGTELKRSVTGSIVDAQPMFHVVGDAANDAILDAMSSIASDQQWKARRPRIEHGTLLRPERFQSASRKGVIVVQNPLHFSLASVAGARFTADRLAVMDPMKSLLDADIKVAIGSDSAGLPGNPFLDLFFAVIQPTRRSEALTLEQAVIAYTKTAAEAEFQEQWKGTIEPGKLADLVVLSMPIFDVSPFDLPGARALLTIVGGKVVHDERGLAVQPR